MIAFYGDYCNTKFGGAARKGGMNVFEELTFVSYYSLFTFWAVLFREVPDNAPIYVEATANKKYSCVSLYIYIYSTS
jgi:hypothetical protein